MTRTEVTGVFKAAEINDASDRINIEFDYGEMIVVVEKESARVFVDQVRLIATLTRAGVSIVGDTTEVKRCGNSHVVRHGAKIEVVVAFREGYTGVYPGEPSCKEKAEVYWEGR